MRGHVVLIIFRQKIWFWDRLVFKLLTVKVTTTKNYFQHYDIGIKLYLPHHTCHSNGAFPHSHANLRSLAFNEEALF